MEQEPTPTPKYGTFEILRDPQKGWWPYEWRPTLAMGIQGVVALLAGYMASELLGYGVWVGFGAGVAMGFVAGVAYNILARYRKWQKLHWLDIALGSDPLIFP